MAGAGSFQCHALQLALLGDLDRAWPLTWVRAPDHFVCHRLHDAVRTWRLGKREQALEALGRIATPSSHLYQGEILAELGRDREAVEGYRRYRRQRGLNLWEKADPELPLRRDMLALERRLAGAGP